MVAFESLLEPFLDSFLLVKLEFLVFIYGNSVMEVLVSGGDLRFLLDEFRSFFFFKGVILPCCFFEDFGASKMDDWFYNILF